MITKLSNTALQGIHHNTRGMTRSAAKIAHTPETGDPSILTRAIVELKQHEHAAKANMKTLAVADKLLGSLLDVKA
jgi:hypothetical protein